MKKIIIAIVGAAVLATGTILVIGQHRSGKGEFGHRNGHHGPLAFLLKGLDLNDEQKAKVKEIVESSRTSAEPLIEQMKANRSKMHDLGKDGTYDQAAVEALANEQGSITAKLIIEKEKAKAQVFAILTDEQKAKAAEMRANFEEKMKGRMHHGKSPTGAEF